MAKCFRITKDSAWVTEVPNHNGYRLTPMVSPASCPGTQVECYIGEFQPEVGGAVDHAHANEDHLFYVLSGRATSKAGDEVLSL